ncbi:histidine--tRNA ligase [Lawsonibacter sp. OA9]|uniref:Histidine--tRNA ligase n=1 Tax=Flintibacter hominis TaxID=2763048 RepID=A0A8J6IYT3_9FIRM|nr:MULTISPECIES: histidine--tRNA ligase [Eubacteriales]MBC5723400.1 histidine--tRNA ligase [Flintibacter hominis]MCH1980868.1 histidine--tRNA ligase [Lawsonibacter sp. OA9]SCH39003.1 Histidine--tRNA ligase [uncultured Clostridium sp.]
MSKVQPRTLSGFMELLPPQQAQFERMAAILRETYSLYGFTPLDTPLIESSEVLLAKGGGETEKQIYRFMKGDTDLSLRFDLTVPLAKYVAQNYGQLTFPFRRFQIGKVYRGERAQRGRFREFYQADIDVIGDGKLDISNEAEIPAIIYQAFSKMGLRRFQIRVNNRKILNGFYAMLGLTDKSGDIMRTVDKLDKIGGEKVAALLTGEDIGLTQDQADEILKFIAIKGCNGEVLAALEGYRGRHALFDTGLDELRTVTKYLAAFGVPESHFAVDLTIARGLDYYTGTVYETTMLDHPEIGSICSGGRYDNLAEYYTDKQLPGVGISIGLTRLFFVLEDQGYLNQNLNTAPADVLILPMTEDLSPAISLATTMRDAGIRTQIHGEQKKFKQKISYADKLAIPYVVFLGEDEIRAGVAAVKDLRTGEQVKLPSVEAVAHIRRGLEQLNRGTPIRDRES